MEENNIIICENCYEENESSRKTCKNCGATLYHNENIKINKTKAKTETESKQNMNNKKHKEDEEEVDYINASNSSNEVANKFTLVVTIGKVIGYALAIITALIIIFGMEEFLIGILSGVMIAIITWLSSLLFEAIAEGLNLLQDIKNKL